jgi:hypothetical protein
MAQLHDQGGTTAATGAAARPRCQCDQQFADSLPVLVVGAAVILLVDRLRSWARRRREPHDDAAR